MGDWTVVGLFHLIFILDLDGDRAVVGDWTVVGLFHFILILVLEGELGLFHFIFRISVEPCSTECEKAGEQYEHTTYVAI